MCFGFIGTYSMNAFSLAGVILTDSIFSVSMRYTVIALSVYVFVINNGLKTAMLLLGFTLGTQSYGLKTEWFSGMVHTFCASISYDYITLLTVCIIFGVSATILIFSIVYMLGDPRQFEFLTLLMIFITCMVFLVSASSLFWFITFWEGIGICSFALISFWCVRVQAVRASVQAMLVNKLGDACMTVGALGLINCFLGDDPLSFNYCPEHLLFIFFLTIVGSISKSALGLFHYWLPYAMEGPTSVSALIHAATLVTAGLFLLLKIKVLLFSGYIVVFLLLLGTFGILLLALVAIDQFDIKRLVAYSTLSQICYMLIVIIIGYPEVGLLYLVVHALFKSLMFMCCGSLIHGFNDQQDTRVYGGLAKTHSITGVLIADSCLVMLGIVGTVGGYSKELIVVIFGSLFSVHCWTVSIIISIGLCATVIYSSYMFLKVFTNVSNHSYLRSADDVGLFTLMVLGLQAIALLSSGGYISTILLYDTGVFSSTDSVALMGGTAVAEYSFAFLCVICIYISRAPTSTRLHSYKYLYDKCLNYVFLWAMQFALLVRSDWLRSILYVKQSLSQVFVSIYRVTYNRIIVFLVLALWLCF